MQPLSKTVWRFLEKVGINLPYDLSISCYRKVCMGSLAACRSKASKQARLVEREVCFISDASNWGAGRVADMCPKAR